MFSILGFMFSCSCTGKCFQATFFSCAFLPPFLWQLRTYNFKKQRLLTRIFCWKCQTASGFFFFALNIFTHPKVTLNSFYFSFPAQNGGLHFPGFGKNANFLAQLSVNSLRCILQRRHHIAGDAFKTASHNEAHTARQLRVNVTTIIIPLT